MDNPGDQPDAHGDQCGSDVFGWETPCFINSATVQKSQNGNTQDIPVPFTDATHGQLCCEGKPSIATADQGCEDICMREACEAARIDHMSQCDACGPWDCGFDMSNCLAGGSHDQTIACLWPLGVGQYTLTVECDAMNNAVRNEDGSFNWIEDPNDTSNDRDLCNTPMNLEHDTFGALAQYSGSSSTGTTARVEWSLGASGGIESADEVDVEFGYGLVPCNGLDDLCLSVRTLKLSLPTTEVLGMTITGAQLIATSFQREPTIERGEDFSFPAESIEVILRAEVDGNLLVLTGHNMDTATGQLAPAGDSFSLSDLRFGFEDSILSATLEVNIQGGYDEHAPTALIQRMAAPSACAEPVVFAAASYDADDEPLEHRWWVPGMGSFSGPLLEVALPAAQSRVVLTSFDPSGRFDIEGLTYTRSCQ